MKNFTKFSTCGKLASPGLILAILCGVSTIWAAPASVDVSNVTGAKVDETNLTPIFVSSEKGAQGNPGTAEKPMLSIGEAVKLAKGNLRTGVGTRIVLQAGIYRDIGIVIDGEQIGGKAVDTPLVIEAENAGEVDWRGSVVRRDWTAVGDPNQRVFRISWTPDPDAAGSRAQMVECIPNRLGRRAEMVFLNGVLLRQVETRGELAAGCYWVEDSSAEATPKSYIYICLPIGIPISGSLIEVSGDQIFKEHLKVEKKNNVVLRGIRIAQGGHLPWTFGAVRFLSADNVLVEKNRFVWNNSDGLLTAQVSRLSVVGNTFSYNGGGGVDLAAGRNQIWENNHFDKNGWRATGLGGQTIWFHAGLKGGFGLRDAIFRSNTFRDNECMGFWLDTDFENILMENLDISDNRRAGMWWEASHGPGVLRNSLISGNARFGLVLTDSGGLTIEGSKIIDNFPAQISFYIASQEGESGRLVVDRDDSKTYRSLPQGIVFKNNVIAAKRADQSVVAFEGDGRSGRELVVKTLEGSGNTYWHPSSENVFAAPIAGAFIKLTFPQWKVLLNTNRRSDNEKGSKWANPSDS